MVRRSVVLINTTMFDGMDRYVFDKSKKKIQFWMMIRNLPNKLVREAKRIDGKNYTSECFGFCYEFCIGTKRYKVRTEVVKGSEKEIFYIDQNGQRHWMNFELPNNVIRNAKAQCNKVLREEGLR